MASSRNMKVWARCNECGEWQEDCDCVCGFVRGKEEVLIAFAVSFVDDAGYIRIQCTEDEDLEELEALEDKYGYFHPCGPDCDRCCQDYYDYHYGEHEDDDDFYSCWECGEKRCDSYYSGECDWEKWANELLSRRNNPLQQLAEGLGLLWQA